MNNTLREKREKIYIKEMTAVQKHWGNPIDNDWNFLKDWSDDELEKNIAHTEDSLNSVYWEKFLSFTKWAVLSIIALFVVLGVVGLLIFGIKQIL